MNATFATPPRPFDVTALFPQLAPLARTATRLHPRTRTPTVHDSSVGGPLLWPVDEPWPYCEEPHDRHAALRINSPDDIRLQRRVLAAAAERLHRGPVAPVAPERTPAEQETLDLIRAGRPWFEGPIPLVSVAQLYARDIPFPCPPDADLLQVLWCPFDHEMAHPKTALVWRSSATVTDVLDARPEPPIVQDGWYLPEPCLFSPEQVTEFPNPLELDKELRDQLDDMSRWETIDPAQYNAYADDPGELYLNNLCTAPGWKTGGWTRWSPTDPVDRACPERSEPLRVWRRLGSAPSQVESSHLVSRYRWRAEFVLHRTEHAQCRRQPCPHRPVRDLCLQPHRTAGGPRPPARTRRSCREPDRCSP
ncbi:hypothetical protein O1Q96_21980 [Streptomyces sp. Qhu-G9]|uniref:hypothetical protein n=1 Tax=Streptomyces sp. Qhu-G9 TaxID=3452799 RepID=UPI0022AC59A5|nr:hypothetical protein [Streptomyces aurantiacus]WAU82203.1 hypothetical protein O1Q96_21980 [Streptomyces aurantiacus]